jgi:hypothetical protein
VAVVIDVLLLLAMDGAGVSTFAAALKNDAAEREASQLQHGGVTHEFQAHRNPLSSHATNTSASRDNRLASRCH